jgi:hypothetical protein
MSIIETDPKERAKILKDELERVSRERNSRANFRIVIRHFPKSEKQYYVRKEQPDGEVIFYRVPNREASNL